MQRWLPDAYLFAVILTFVVLLAGMILEQQSAMAMVQYWGDSLWNLLGFSMQMLLILVTGHVLAQAPPIHRVLVRIACLPQTPTQAILLVTFCSGLASWINWGFGLITAALIARETGKRVAGLHYPLLVASAYSGFILWHAGISGSIPLVIASPGTDVIGELLGGKAIGFGDTVFSLPVLLIVLLLLLTLPILNTLMRPEPAQVVPFKEPSARPDLKEAKPSTPAQQIEHSRLLALAFGGLGVIYLGNYFLAGGAFTFNIVIMLFLVSGILLHGAAASYLAALAEAIKGVGGIVLQYPLYAGIMGMMQQSGLAASIANGFVEISTSQTFSVYTFISAGIVNFFVPSGGGQWAVQGPIVLPAADALGVDRAQVAMAVAFGDAWTNLIQPFWALPMLAIAGLKIRDIMGYCTVALLWSGLIISAGILFFF